MQDRNGAPNPASAAVFQAFAGMAVSLFLLFEFEGGKFGWTMWRGGGTAIAVAVFLGTLGYRLGQQYLAGDSNRSEGGAKGPDYKAAAGRRESIR